MGTAAQKKKLFDGLPPKEAKKKFIEVWLKSNPDTNFNRLNKDFAKAHKGSLLSWFEVWHRLRSHNHTVELMVQSFAQTVAHKNKQNHDLSKTIHDQREQLAKLQTAFNTAKAQLIELSEA